MSGTNEVLRFSRACLVVMPSIMISLYPAAAQVFVDNFLGALILGLVIVFPWTKMRIIVNFVIMSLVYGLAKLIVDSEGPEYILMAIQFVVIPSVIGSTVFGFLECLSLYGFLRVLPALGLAILVEAASLYASSFVSIQKPLPTYFLAIAGLSYESLVLPNLPMQTLKTLLLSASLIAASMHSANIVNALRQVSLPEGAYLGSIPDVSLLSLTPVFSWLVLVFAPLFN